MSLSRALLPLLVLGLFAGCGFQRYFDPCQQLAYRICSCETTQARRQACEQQRIQTQADTATREEGAEEVCAAALETCTCTALDNNRADLCGFTRDPDLEEDDEDEGFFPWGEPA